MMFPFHANNQIRRTKPKKCKISFRHLLLFLAILFVTCISYLSLIFHNHHQYHKTYNEELVDTIIKNKDDFASHWRGVDKNKIKTEENRGGLTNRNKIQNVKQTPKVAKEETRVTTPPEKALIQQQKKETKYEDICLNSISQLTYEERHPSKGKRHMVSPPHDTNITLVCCQTTAGPLSIAVHKSWAPIGAERFLNMVHANYFQSYVPLFRCIKNFICQFGLAGSSNFTKMFDGNLEDERQWLQEGPNGRVNSDGVKRFAKGYLAYAGGGRNSRSNQFIVALGDNRYLGGGSPWEVPWGEVVGKASFKTLDRIYTGYGDNGPGQGLLRKKGGANKEIINMFPKMDYINSCVVVDQIHIDI